MPSSAPYIDRLTPEHVVALISKVEERHRVVWTAGRILKEDGCLHQVMTGEPAIRRQALARIRRILKNLVRDGVLSERGFQFNYGMTTEVGYDFLAPKKQQAGQADAGDGLAIGG
jgi:hypothetical protein